MAKNVIAQILGADKKVLDDVATVGEVKSKLNATGYTASVNGDSQTDSFGLEDGDFVLLSQAVKGGRR